MPRARAAWTLRYTWGSGDLRRNEATYRCDECTNQPLLAVLMTSGYAPACRAGVSAGSTWTGSAGWPMSRRAAQWICTLPSCVGKPTGCPSRTALYFSWTNGCGKRMPSGCLRKACTSIPNGASWWFQHASMSAPKNASRSPRRRASSSTIS
ncbi:Uncharacterised protein [Bordetella pertussis]|nr:Uncharacterised protein [Bordetella pertussis]